MDPKYKPQNGTTLEPMGKPYTLNVQGLPGSSGTPAAFRRFAAEASPTLETDMQSGLGTGDFLGFRARLGAWKV